MCITTIVIGLEFVTRRYSSAETVTRIVCLHSVLLHVYVHRVTRCICIPHILHPVTASRAAGNLVTSILGGRTRLVKECTLNSAILLGTS